MPFIAQETIDQVKKIPDIVQVISEYVTLKKRGRNYLGLCPFHSEKSPSFTVSPEKRLFHCFGCHESGDHITFVMKADNLSFAEAIRQLALKSGIEVKEVEQSNSAQPRDQDYEQVQDILYTAREYYKSHLTPDSEAYHYLTKRGLTDQTITQFHLGFSPEEDTLLGQLESKGFTQNQLLKSGIIFQTDYGQLKCRFRNRVIFPVIDYLGRTVGFGGRTLSTDPKTAKYVNSEESLLFNKRKLIYNLDKAKKAIKAHGMVLVMEGYMDVITAYQFGFENVIATMGTALTPQHVQKLKRFTNTVYMAMDSDDAGQNAIDKSIDLLYQHDMTIKVVRLDEKDPADMLLQNGRDAFDSKINNAIHVVDFMFQRACQQFNPKDIEQIPKILSQVIPILRKERDSIIQRHYVQKIASELNIQEELIMAKIKRSQYNIRSLFSVQKSRKDKIEKAEELILKFMALDLNFRRKITELISINEIKTSVNQNLYQVLITTDQNSDDLLNQLDGSIKAQLSRILIEPGLELSSASAQQECQDAVKTLQDQSVLKRVEELKVQLKEKESVGDEGAVLMVLQELQQLKNNAKKT